MRVLSLVCDAFAVLPTSYSFFIQPGNLPQAHSHICAHVYTICSSHVETLGFSVPRTPWKSHIPKWRRESSTRFLPPRIYPIPKTFYITLPLSRLTSTHNSDVFIVRHCIYLVIGFLFFVFHAFLYSRELWRQLKAVGIFFVPLIRKIIY